MDRRTFLAGAGVVVAVTGTGATPAGASRRTALPAVEWELFGGFVGPGFTQLRPAQLAVYPDGRAIVNAEKQLGLRRSQVDDLLRRTVAVLRDPANGVRRPGAPVVADAPSTIFQARDGQRLYKLQAKALGESRDFNAYPAPTYALLDRLTAIRDRVAEVGRPYRVAGVRMVVVRADDATGAIAWPRAIKVPTVDGVSGTVDLKGTAANTVVRLMPRRDANDWQLYRTSNGRLLRATWRYLMPDEL